MRSIKYQPSVSALAGPANDSVPPAPLSDWRLATLIQAHSDLDGAIAALLASGNRDDLQITRLKKRKLHLKDEIVGASPGQ